MTRAAVLACLILALPAAQAATTCRMVSVGDLSFGIYDVLSAAPNDTLMNVTVSCDRDGGPPSVTLNVGLGAGSNGSDVSARRLAKAGLPADYLSYGLYRDVGRSSVWGNTNGIDTMSTTLAVPNKGSASANLTIYARIPAQQDVSAGAYGDLVQITVSP